MRAIPCKNAPSTSGGPNTYVRVADAIYDPKFPILRDEYDDRWGLTLYSRLVFTVYLSSGESQLKPYIADIGARTFLVNQRGARFQPSGTFNYYPYQSDRPEGEVLDGKTYYRVFFPNRQRQTTRRLLSSATTTISNCRSRTWATSRCEPCAGSCLSRTQKCPRGACRRRPRWPSARRQSGPSARRGPKQRGPSSTLWVSLVLLGKPFYIS